VFGGEAEALEEEALGAGFAEAAGGAEGLEGRGGFFDEGLCHGGGWNLEGRGEEEVKVRVRVRVK
jgi:hypothetical protein